MKTIQTTVKLECPVKGCGKALSVRDLNDLLKNPKHVSTDQPAPKSKGF
jgi:hypothetical protein